MPWKVDELDIRGDGRVVLYKRPGLKNPKWQAKISVPNAPGSKRISTKATDLDEAKRFALDLYEQIYLRVKAGGVVNSRTFGKVFEEWSKSVSLLGPTRQGGSWDDTIARIKSYALGYFEKAAIEKIGPREFTDYLVWRQSNFSKKQPSNSTLRRERASILAVFSFAKDRGYITDSPNFPSPKFKRNRRPTFTQNEWRTIYRNAQSWVNDGYRKAVGRDRFLAHRFFLVMANTGMRTGELRNLKWEDLRTVLTDDGTTRLIATVDGKTGEREVVFQPKSERSIEKIYDMREGELGKSPDLSEFVFCTPDGQPIKSYKNSFKSLLKHCGVPIEKNGLNRTPYSLRHFYATTRLENDTNPFLLSKQMGSSVEMIERHYGQVISSRVALQITKGNQSGTLAKSGKYPFN